MYNLTMTFLLFKSLPKIASQISTQPMLLHIVIVNKQAKTET